MHTETEAAPPTEPDNNKKLAVTIEGRKIEVLLGPDEDPDAKAFEIIQRGLRVEQQNEVVYYPPHRIDLVSFRQPAVG